MKTNNFRPNGGVGIVSVLWLSLALALTGCANTVVYQHTTSVRASAEELDVNVLGFVSDVHIKDGMVDVSFTTVITVENAIEGD